MLRIGWIPHADHWLKRMSGVGPDPTSWLHGDGMKEMNEKLEKPSHEAGSAGQGSGGVDLSLTEIHQPWC